MSGTKVVETTPSETKPEKMVRKNVAVALGVVCIILIMVSLIGAFVYYTPIINDKDKTISSLDSRVSLLTSNVTNLQYWLDVNETYFQNQIAQYIMVLRFGFTNYTVWANSLSISQGPNSYDYFAIKIVNQTGYVLVNVQSSTNNTYVQENYYASKAYENRVDVGTTGTVIFPVPLSPAVTSGVLIMIGNTNPTGANITATVTFYH